MPRFNEEIYREPTEKEIMEGIEFELCTMSGWVAGTYPSILDMNSQLDEYGDDYEMKLAHAIIRIKK